MIKHNDSSTSINVLAEGELDQVVGGYCHKGGSRRGWGGGWGGGCHKRDYDKGHDKRDYDKAYEEPSEGYSSASSGDSFEVNNQVIQLEININQVAV